MKRWVFGLGLALLLGCSEGTNLQLRAAPDGTLAERHAWGLKTLGRYYEPAVQWIHMSPQIARDIGKVRATAPSGYPNYVESFFTDGEVPHLHIEVLGKTGRGFVEFPPFYLTEGPKRAFWLVMKTGQPLSKQDVDTASEQTRDATQQKLEEQNNNRIELGPTGKRVQP